MLQYLRTFTYLKIFFGRSSSQSYIQSQSSHTFFLVDSNSKRNVLNSMIE